MSLRILGVAHKLIGNTLPISARVGKAKLAMNLEHIGKFSCLCLLYMCLRAVFMVLGHQFGNIS